MKRLNHNNLKGFSLIEVLVVITIISILAGVATISWQRWHQHNQQQFAHANIITELKQLRYRALQLNQNYRCQTKNQELQCDVWQGSGNGPAQWKYQQSSPLVKAPLTLKIKKSTFLHFLSSGEIPPFTLQILKGEKIVYELQSTQLAKSN